ncbi:MAG: ATP-binding cassette domain-containing protein, partial [Rhodococcus sp. (in: high G+C Gram-positive bacteria)]
MTTDATHLKITDLTVHYGPVTALDSVSMTVTAGTITAVLGANGAGKTTLLRTVSGLLRPTSGRIELAGVDIVGIPPDRMSRKGLAHVPEG